MIHTVRTTAKGSDQHSKDKAAAITADPSMAKAAVSCSVHSSTRAYCIDASPKKKLVKDGCLLINLGRYCDCVIAILQYHEEDWSNQ